MVYAKGRTNKPNPTHQLTKKVYPIGGIQVEFPYRPYGSQLAFMGRVISTLDRAQREGHCHALLESPTGTGKSLSLLCSTLAWQKNYKIKNQDANSCHSKPAPEAAIDPLAFGGGFIPEMQPSTSVNTESSLPVQNNKSQKKKTAPTIYYASRTHSQISQVIREYRKTTYRVPMAVLASRKHFCTNPHVRGKDNIDEQCKLLLRDQDAGCYEFKNFNKVKSHPTLQRGGCHEVHDIEDLVKVGEVVKGCSYYAARSMADDAQLVFCPYSYVVNPVIRGAMDVDIKGAIVILDEAHNIEDIARHAGSVDLDEDTLNKLQMELEQLCYTDSLVYQPLYEMTQDLISWIDQRKTTLQKREFQHYVTCWTGNHALRELQEANITQQCFPILLECATKAIKAGLDTESDAPHLSGLSVITLEGLFSSLTYFFSRNGCHMSDYQLALQRHVKRDPGNVHVDWTHTFSLWCLNPAVVFRDIGDLSLSVILTSGTLSPMNSFSSELGVQFGTSLEAPHVIDVESQVWPAIISSGPGNYPLNGSYKTADGYAFQDALGKSLEEIFLIAPGGCLVFFPSYKLMEKLQNRWSETGQWSRLNARKSLFVEPRGGTQEDFDSLLKGYYDTIRLGDNFVVEKKRRGKKVKPNHPYVIGCENPKEGAALFAVFRGKVSEGIDFSDDNARVVIIVGIPFPNINDIQVSLKKKFNDTYKLSKNLLSGNEWYCQQAFRALNQAAGRCIRHKFDYGAIVLLDERFQEERNRAYISKWLRKSIKQFDNFEQSMEGLKSFFGDIKERISKNTESDLQKFENEEHITLTDPGSFRRKKIEKFDKTYCGQKVHEDPKNCIIDLECSVETDTRNHEFLSMATDLQVPDSPIVQETPCVDVGGIPSPGDSKDERSTSTIIEAYSEFPDQFSNHSLCFTKSTRTPLTSETSMLHTPERNVAANAYSFARETESLDMSVNSHTQKRRKSMGLTITKLAQEEFVDDPKTKNPKCNSLDKSSIISGSLNSPKDSSYEIVLTEGKSKSSNVPQVLNLNDTLPVCLSAGLPMDKKLHLSCALCRNPLGRPENHLYLSCSFTVSSKTHLISTYKESLKPQNANLPTNIPVVMTDILFVNQRLLVRSSKGSGRGIWSEEDGCVFNSVFCPFCCTDNCIGVQIMATDASNIQLLDKVMFYLERLEIQDLKANTEKASVNKEILPVSSSAKNKSAVMEPIENFSYSPGPLTSGGWRSTKLKVRRKETS
ncbi:Fanconi anemia group J protein homolog [Cucurbita moschata]|uniref:DNA 5'-3' helicase FANCJ n=1 Tax=Cucurbita moschata TaxID=3662 RepID=A0A6J1FF24_CUCMO|nr:Fanconi anemia group J protein homolog [Cucurbita moschata]